MEWISASSRQGERAVTELSISVPLQLKDQKKELGTGLFRAMCKDLGISPQDI
jgi:hypothetical protein